MHPLPSGQPWFSKLNRTPQLTLSSGSIPVGEAAQGSMQGLGAQLAAASEAHAGVLSGKHMPDDMEPSRRELCPDSSLEPRDTDSTLGVGGRVTGAVSEMQTLTPSVANLREEAPELAEGGGDWEPRIEASLCPLGKISPELGLLITTLTFHSHWPYQALFLGWPGQGHTPWAGHYSLALLSSRV